MEYKKQKKSEIKQTEERQRKDGESGEEEKRRKRENKGRNLVRTVEETEQDFTVKTQLLKNCRNSKCLF